MDRGVLIFRVEQLQLYYFLIPCSEGEDITMSRNVEICSRKYTASYKKSWVRQQCRCENLTSRIREYFASHLTFQRPTVTSTPLVMVWDT